MGKPISSNRLLRVLPFFLIIFLAQCGPGATDKDLITKITGSIEDTYYISPGKLFKVDIPVSGFMGGCIRDDGDENEKFVVEFYGTREHYEYAVFTIISDVPAEQLLENIRKSPWFHGVDTIETPWGPKTCTQYLKKEGSISGYRQMQRDGTQGERKRDDVYVSQVHIKIGKRYYLLSVGAVDKPGNFTYKDKNKLFPKAGKRLDFFVKRFTVLTE